MPLYDTIVKNGLVVTASDRGHYDIAIKAGKIVRLEAYLDDEDAEQVIDAEGGMVMPGGQDLETSEGVIGLRCADNFETGSRSGVCGGTTTMISFAQQLRNDTSLLAVVNAYDARAKATGSYVDYAYHVVVSNPTPEILETEFPQLVERGITSIKLFMTYDSLRLSDSQLLDVMLAGRRHGITILLHAENGDVIEWLTDKLEKQGMLAPIYHTHSRPQIVETEAVSRAILLAELVQTPLVLGHVSASGAARAIREAQDRDLPIFGETCPQYLFLTHDDLTKFAPPNAFDNSKYVCSPPPGSDDRDQEAIWTGLRNGTFTLFSSNHCPYVYDDPEGSGLDLTTSLVEGESPPPAGGEELAAWASDKEGNFRYIPNSCPGIETRLPLLFSKGVETGRISAEKFVELTSTNVAKLYGLYPKKGSLQPGSDADIVIWNPQCATEPFSINHGNLHSAVGYTPYEGQCLQNWPRWTIVRGKIIFAEGELVEKGPGHGKFVKRGKSQLGKEVRGGDLEKDMRRVAAWLDI